MRRLFFSILSVALVAAARNCKCSSYDSCWPSDAAFQNLQSQLSVPLLHPKPPESACYPPSQPSGNCTDVKLHTMDGNWRADQPGSMHAPNFESFVFPNGTIEACYLNTTLGVPCGQGSVSVVGVDARTIGDIQAAVDFAGRYNLRLVVKNTGHDFAGRSAARGSLLLWTHHMKNITYNPSFVPTSATTSETYKALTLGAGVQWHEAYGAADAEGRVIVGGVSPGSSVGAAGGWVLGGGHGTLSARHGLGVDNTLEFTIVTADARHLTVNAYQYPDLFWALRGGGGGTYGVVTSVTYCTYDGFPMSGFILIANFTSPAIARDATAAFLRVNIELAEAGWGGFASILPNNIGMSYMAPNFTVNGTIAKIEPFFRSIQNITGDVIYRVQPYDSYYAWVQAFTGTSRLQTGIRMEMASRLIPRKSIDVNSTQLAEIFISTGGVRWAQVAGGAVSRVDARSTGLNPAWREAVGLALWIEEWSDGTSFAGIQAIHESIKRRTNMIDSVAPLSGSYLGQASLHENDFKQTFFGSHYGELKQIKRKYDPEDLFILPSGVGSDDWDETITCRR